MNHFVHCCSFSTCSNKITSKGCQSASQTCDFDAKNAKFFWGGGTDLSLSGEGDNPSPHPLGASILTPPILKFWLCYWLRPKLLKKLAPATWRTPHWYEMCFANDQATFDHACIKTTVHTVPGGIRTVPPGHTPPIQFPLPLYTV